MKKPLVRVLVTLSVLTMSACTDDGSPTSRENPISQGGTGGATSGHAANGGSGGNAGNTAKVTLSDPEIAAIMQVVNAIEVKQNTIAASRTTTQEVRRQAVDFATAHSEANAHLLSVLLEQDIEPKESAVTKRLWTTSERMVKALRTADASEFDALYVQQQIDAHKTVLEAIDTTLTPAVKNDALKTEFKAERAAVAAHLKRAQALAKTLHLDVDAGAPEDAGM